MEGVTTSNESATAAIVLSSAAFGSISGFCSSVLLQPFDRLKTLSQEDAVRKTNVIQRTATVIRHHGPLDLWRGIVPTLLRVVPGVAVYFGCLEVGRTFVPRGANKNASNFLLGAVSRSVAVALLMPATVIKTRFESSVYRDASVLSAAVNVLNQNGMRGLFKGMVPTLMRDAPFSGLYLLFYRQYLRLFNKEGRVHLPAIRFSSGVLAGLMACAVTQPFDITKTHVQLYPQRYRSVLCVIGHLYSRGGIIAFFNGFWLRAVRRTLMSAMNWTIFDELFGSRVHDD
uniref:Solute carrier family 25 member 38 n=1 Tax=Parascaris univalens TaxID=6257 RepID=A0A915ADF0_PARUN